MNQFDICARYGTPTRISDSLDPRCQVYETEDVDTMIQTRREKKRDREGNRCKIPGDRNMLKSPVNHIAAFYVSNLWHNAQCVLVCAYLFAQPANSRAKITSKEIVTLCIGYIYPVARLIKIRSRFGLDLHARARTRDALAARSSSIGRSVAF